MRTRAMLILLLLVSLLAWSDNTHPPSTNELAELIGRADRVVVYESGRGQANLLYSSSNPQDLAALKSVIAVQSIDGLCMCTASHRIELYRKERRIAVIEVIDATLLRLPGWSSDAAVQDPQNWLQWFDGRHIPALRQRFEADIAQAKADEANRARWNDAMPASIRPLWPPVSKNWFPGTNPDFSALRAALANEYPETPARIRKLMSWYGSGAGPWSGFPMYEAVPERMLLDYSTAELIAAIQGASLNDTEQEGAARLFGGWEFSQQRPADYVLIPADVKRLLLAHCLKSSDEDKLARARAAFGEPSSH